MNHLGGQGYSRLDKVATKGTMFIWLSFCVCTRRKPLRDLEIEHVSRTVASVYNHMLNGLWLSQLHWEDPCIVFKLLDMRTWNPTWVLKTS